MPKIRTVRFTDAEEKDIDIFLKNNPFFDFSSLARLSICQFLQDPQLPIMKPNHTSAERNTARRPQREK